MMMRATQKTPHWWCCLIGSRLKVCLYCTRALILKYSPVQLMRGDDDGEDANCAEEQWIWLGVCFCLAWCWSFLAQSCLPNDTSPRWAFLYFSTRQISINTWDVHSSLKNMGNSLIKMIIAPKMENFLSGYCSEQSCYNVIIFWGKAFSFSK